MSVLDRQGMPLLETAEEKTPSLGGLSVTRSVLDLQGMPLREPAKVMTLRPSKGATVIPSALSLLLCN